MKISVLQKIWAQLGGTKKYPINRYVFLQTDSFFSQIAQKLVDRSGDFFEKVFYEPKSKQFYIL